MRIVHLTDFHYISGKDSIEYDTKRLVDSLCSSLDNKQIDYVFFTGDLVFSGKNQDDFSSAKSSFLDRVLSTLNLSENDLFICCGNHDVYRDQEMDAIRTHINNKIKTNEDLDSFVSDRGDVQFIESCKNSTNFTEFHNSFLSKGDSKENELLSPLHSIYTRIFNGKKIGIVSINTAWRANCDEDNGSLLFPISFIKDCLQRIDLCDCKIILSHHPLSFFEEFNKDALEDIICQNFHFILSGHIHKKSQSMYITSQEGILCCTAPATLDIRDTSSKIGFTILDIDMDTHEVLIENFIYNKDEYMFIPLEPLDVQIPMGKVKKDLNEFRKTIKKRYKLEAEKSNDVLLSGQKDESKVNFLELFTNPIVKTVPKAELADKSQNAHHFDYINLIDSNENIILYGSDKSGKTSLLRKILLELLNNFQVYSTIPYYINCLEFKTSLKPINLLKRLARYCEKSQNHMSDLLKNYNLKILIDNFDPQFDLFNNQIKEFLSQHPKCSILATSPETISETYEIASVKDLFSTKLYIYEITRNEIRSLTKKWPNIPQDKIEIILDKIIRIFKQIHIPYNYWTVSLFLWIFEKTKDVNFNNNNELIELYIDNLLERKKIALGKISLLPFENLKVFLSELSKYLIENFHENGYCASYAEIVNFTESYRKRNVRFVVGTKEILDYMIERGIIYKKVVITTHSD